LHDSIHPKGRRATEWLRELDDINRAVEVARGVSGVKSVTNKMQLK
jgi:hypothetical protein